MKKISRAAAVRHLNAADPELARVIARVGPCRMDVRDGKTPRFVSLARAIIFQQLSGKAAETICGRVVAVCGGELSAAAITKSPDAKLRAAGLSRGKLAALRDLSTRSLDNRLALHELDKLSDEEIIAQLVAVRGIGVWTAQMFLMFHLGRPDVLPVLDLGIRKGFAKVTGMKRLPAASTLNGAPSAGAPTAPSPVGISGGLSNCPRKKRINRQDAKGETTLSLGDLAPWR